MGLLSLFGKSDRQRKFEQERRRAKTEDLDLYPGMRLEITTDDGRLFLVAELLELRGDRAKLRTFIDGRLLAKSDAPISVTMRGYSSKRNGAVVAKAKVRSGSSNIWYAEHVELAERSDRRATFRIDVDLEGTAVPTAWNQAPEEPCRLRNISTGGVCISMGTRHDVGDKLLLRAQLFPDGEQTALACQIVRILQHRYDYFEYGCRFLYVDPTDENLVLRAIFDAQKHK